MIIKWHINICYFDCNDSRFGAIYAGQGCYAFKEASPLASEKEKKKISKKHSFALCVLKRHRIDLSWRRREWGALPKCMKGTKRRQLNIFRVLRIYTKSVF